MNTDTGELKRLQDLTEAERKSEKWKEVPNRFSHMTPSQRLRELKREEYMKKVADKKREGVNR